MPKALKITSDSVEEIEVSNSGQFLQDADYPVSYTHLTLPTIYSV